ENAQKFLDEQAKVLGELYPKAAAESEGKTDESKDTGSTQTPPAGEAPDTESTADTESKSTNE
ncbi:MAG: pilus assembly protein CpaB, partial [Angelakisella sp.]